ncbi:MICOS complex subunit MIC25 [Apis cerana]|uniref:MICOS complex subunit MIC25 isoform X1 n=3 Tax=Apis TaxID=7459 RepID=A0A7M7SRM2_APIME|nr:MICOS complex subunit MIC25 [Apis cerana]XP_026300805.1 MICOS complex subunit MIC25 isoform X1 [Apis mellifera]XP_028519855.1 MICOS complex subunit MIC25 [Apis cerana]XP_061941224.1 MICOS complex subunit MIC25 [Apis cerana]XP_061941225.1 MICOS complex subunit MIC25 [Apis cerana]XP_061941226.1 MICOS complex subunit MIC25 [Apis cerana]XP_061941227.1 MICOS complex subunit MIC25 [Apis cerana]XP_624132.1 MICOS complex subunit MIC25 isoform X1 [Apis mellifera]KAG6797877.1 MICOS complex subunit|eukprot:XP_026300805.1 MICOS complex subunit MIC25 isoform X1 [Apis mellifera]
MGSGQSARKLTINNEEIDVIEISESVVERLTQKMNEEKPNVANEVRSATLTDSKKTASSQLSQSDIPVNAGYPIYQPQLTLTALQIQQQKEKEFRNQDNYWQKRLQDLEQKHSEINNIINAEYKKAAEQLNANDKDGINAQDTIQPCKSNSDKVFKCYQDYPKEILNCSSLVEEFSNCVDQRRAQVIAAR